MTDPITTNLLGRRAYIDNNTTRRGERGEIVTVSHGAGGVLSLGLLYDDGHIEEYVASSNPHFHICRPETPDVTRFAAHDLRPSAEPNLAQQLDRHQISLDHARAFYGARYHGAATDAEVAKVLSHHEPGAIPPAREFLLPKEDEVHAVALAHQLHCHKITAEHARAFYKSRYPDNDPTDEAVALVLSGRDPGSIPPADATDTPAASARENGDLRVGVAARHAYCRQHGRAAVDGDAQDELCMWLDSIAPVDHGTAAPTTLIQQLDRHQISFEQAQQLFAFHYPTGLCSEGAMARLLARLTPRGISAELVRPLDPGEIEPDLARQLDRHQIAVEEARAFYAARYSGPATDVEVARILSAHEPGSIPPAAELLLPAGPGSSLNLAEQLGLHHISVARARAIYAEHHPGVDPNSAMLAAFLKDYQTGVSGPTGSHDLDL